MKLVNLVKPVSLVKSECLDRKKCRKIRLQRTCVTCAGSAGATFKPSLQRQHFLVTKAVGRLLLLTDLKLFVHLFLYPLANTQLAECIVKRIVAQDGGVRGQREVVTDCCLVEELYDLAQRAIIVDLDWTD